MDTTKMEPQSTQGYDGAADMESFYRARRFLASVLDLEELLRAILEEGLDAVRGTRGFVGLVNHTTGELEFPITAGDGWDERHARAIPISDAPGSGITVRVVCTGVPYVCGDVRKDPHYRMFFNDVRSEIAVPLVDRDGHTIGIINVESEKADAFSQRDLQLLVALANQAAIAIDVANYRASEAELIEIGNQLSSSSDMDELLRRVVQSAARLLRADDCSLFQLNPNAGRLILRAAGEMLDECIGTHTYRIGEGLTGWVAENQKPVRLSDVRSDERWRGLYPELPAEAIESYLAAPVLDRKGLWGVLRVVRRKPATSALSYDFNERDEKLLMTLARQVGAAITQQTLIDRQVQIERMAAWGEMSARSAHMIGNKVFALKGQLNELEHLARHPDFSRERVLEVVERAKQGVFRLEEILNEFRDFLLATHLNLQECDLNSIVAASVAENLPPSGPVRARLELTDDLPSLQADESKLRRALGELLENAASHLPNGGDVTVRTGHWREEDEGTYAAIQTPIGFRYPGLRIDVQDLGPGVPPENKTRLFDPFFTTRSKGMGLGLSIVKGIIDAHHGAIAEVGRPGEGAHFIIVLPAG